jgi:hypothetical protein
LPDKQARSGGKAVVRRWWGGGEAVMKRWRGGGEVRWSAGGGGEATEATVGRWLGPSLRTVVIDRRRLAAFTEAGGTLPAPASSPVIATLSALPASPREVARENGMANQTCVRVRVRVRVRGRVRVGGEGGGNGKPDCRYRVTVSRCSR